MVYVVISLVVLIILLCITLFIFGKTCKKYKRRYEAEKIKAEQLQEEYSKLAEAYRIKKENKEKADAEISNLHNGNTTADNILPKRKNRA